MLAPRYRKNYLKLPQHSGNLAQFLRSWYRTRYLRTNANSIREVLAYLVAYRSGVEIQSFRFCLYVLKMLFIYDFQRKNFAFSSIILYFTVTVTWICFYLYNGIWWQYLLIVFYCYNVGEFASLLRCSRCCKFIIYY